MIADKLAEVRLRDGSAEWILLHIEVQSQRDPRLTQRVLDYNYRISNLLASHNPFAWLTLVHLSTQQARRNPGQLYADKLRLTALLFKHRWNRKRIITLFNAMNWMMVLSRPDQRRYWQTILELEQEHKMKLMNPLEQMFFDDGVEKGLEQGRKEGAVLLEQLLTQRFGPLPKAVHNKLLKASMEQLTAWAVALPAAQSLKQIFQ